MSVIVGGIAAAELDDMDIPALSWTVPGLVPQGFGIVAAASKLGNSWLVLSLGLAVALGTSFLGVLVEQRLGRRLPLLRPVRQTMSVSCAHVGRRVCGLCSERAASSVARPPLIAVCGGG